MNNDVVFAGPAHGLLLKSGPVSTDRQTCKSMSSSLLASPQAARKKKRYVKLDLSSLILQTHWASSRPHSPRRTLVKETKSPPDMTTWDRSATLSPKRTQVMSERPLMIVSLNLRGLGKDSNKQKLIRTWLASLQNSPQILLIQEHHLDEQGTANSTRDLDFWQGTSF